MTAMQTCNGRKSRIASIVLLSLVAAACSGRGNDEEPAQKRDGSINAGPVSGTAAATDGGGTHDAGDRRIEPIIPEPSEACPELTAGAQTIMGLRTEIVAGTPGATKGPMLFAWHGNPGTGQGALSAILESVQQDIVQQGGLIIAPTSNGEIRSGVNVAGRAWFDEHDLRLVDLIVACGVKNHNIDPRRIYTTGCSAGGLFAACMAARRSSYVAAAAPNSGGFSFPQPFQDMNTPALMTVHGAAGRDVVVIDFSTSSKTADTAFKNRGGFVINCDHGGGHCGGAGQAPSMWQFFKAHPFGTKPSPWASALPAGFDAKCKIF